MGVSGETRDQELEVSANQPNGRLCDPSSSEINRIPVRKGVPEESKIISEYSGDDSSKQNRSYESFIV